jgi:hypothetical protein
MAGMGLNALFASPSVLLDYYAPGAPGTPQSASAVPGNGNATLHWHVPVTNGDSPIVGYVVTPYNGVVPLAPQSFPASPTTRVITGLTNGKSYIFKVAAVNGSGLGPQSAASIAIKVGSPGAPTAPKAIPGKNQVTLKWVVPTATNGGAVTGYAVTPYLSGVPLTVRVFNSPATTDVIAFLINGRSYTFRVAARNKFGTSLASPLTAAVLVAGAPAPPSHVKAARAARGQLRVAFTPGVNNGLPITSFTATCISGKAGGVTNTKTGAASPLVVTGLTLNKAYYCNVKGINARGAGPASPKSNTVIP